MKVTKTDFEGLLVIEPTLFEDKRGYFFEAYNQKSFADGGIACNFVQDNQSHSRKGVVRGLHFQIPPYAQTKLVRVLTGTIQDVVLDLRKKELTFGKHFSIELSSENKKQILIPPGFAHGFVVLSNHADVLYKCDQVYKPEMERGIIFNDPNLKIDWRIDARELIYSVKDTNYPTFANAEIFF